MSCLCVCYAEMMVILPIQSLCFIFWLIEMMILWVQREKKNESLSKRSAKCTKSRVTQGSYRKDRAMSSKDWSQEKAESHEEHHWEESKSVSTLLFEINCCIWDSGFSGLHWEPEWNHVCKNHSFCEWRAWGKMKVGWEGKIVFIETTLMRASPPIITAIKWKAEPFTVSGTEVIEIKSRIILLYLYFMYGFSQFIIIFGSVNSFIIYCLRFIEFWM